MLEVLKSPLLNFELFSKVYEKEKEIKSYGESIKLEIINSPFFTIDMFNYYINLPKFYDLNVVDALINSKFADEDAYIKLVLNCFVDKGNLYIKIMNSPCFSSKVLETIISLKPSDTIVSKCLDNIFLNEKIFSDIIELCFKNKYTYEESVKKIFVHKDLTKALLIKILKVYSQVSSQECEHILNNQFCDSDVLKEFDIRNQSILTKILEHPKINSEVLMYFLENYGFSEQSICQIIDCVAVDESVLLKCIEIHTKMSSYGKFSVNKIIYSPAVTEKVLLEIVNSFLYIDILEKVLEHPLANKEIKLAVLIKKIPLDTKDIDYFFNIDNLNMEDIILLLNEQSSNSYIVEKAIDFEPVNQVLYKKIISVIYEKKIRDYSRLIKKLLQKDLEEPQLVSIIKNETSIDLLKDAINHPNAGLKVVAMVKVVCDDLSKANQDELLALAKELTTKIISKIYKIEQEENVTEILRMNVEDRMATMLWGPSGVGKTSRVFEVDPTATLLILKNGMLPEEVIGGKEPNGNPGEIYPPHWYKLLCQKCSDEPERMHILFIDEFTNVSDTIKNLVWEVIGNRLVNGHEEWPLPENCSIVVAGNRPEESSAVRIDVNGGVMPAPLHNRIDSMLEIKFDIDEWQKWALETDPKTGNLRIHPIVYSFCVANAEKVMFTQFNAEDVTQPFLSPRKWEQLSKALYSAEKRGENHHVSNARIISILGNSDITTAFMAHYERLPIDMNKIIKGEYSEEDFPTIEDKLYALGIVIAKYEGDELAIESFITECLGDEYLSIYYNMKKMRNSMLIDSEVKKY